MKIIKYKKGKGSLYEVFLDTENIKLYEDIILKYDLLLKKKISEKELEQIKKDNDSYRCYDKSIRYLSKKMRTEKEVKEYLKKEEFSEKMIEETITKLKQSHYLDEDAYIKAFLNDKMKFSLDGPLKIQKQLGLLGLPKIKIDEYISNVSGEVWKERIQKIIEKKMNANHKESEKMLKNKITHYLLTNGYSYDLILEEINQIHSSKEKMLYEKEKEKLRKKLSQKYEGEELEFQIKKRLYQKGFDCSF